MEKVIHMGGGSWDPGVYSSTTRAAMAAGTTFGYSSSVHSGAVAAKAHDMLDPKKVAGPTSPLAGQIVREARDSDDHPTSVPLKVAFDQTGSMGRVPRILQTKLAELYALILRKGYLEHPQLAVGAYGDMRNGEAAPIQIGQFESDNRADETLDNIYLEGNGGGNGGESAAGVWLYAALHTATDAWEKRGKKGYLFTVGDERTHGVTVNEWKRYVDADTTLERDLTAQEIADMAKERWEVYHVLINNSTAQMQRSQEQYEQLLGKDHVIVLEDEESVCETIALLIGMAEGTIDLDDGLADLDDVGATGDRRAISRALAHVDASAGAVAVADAPSELGLGTVDGAERL